MSMMPPKAAKTCTMHTPWYPVLVMLEILRLCWSMLIYAGLYQPQFGGGLEPIPRTLQEQRSDTSRRDFLRVSTLILSLRLFTYLPDLKGRGQARLEPKLKWPAMPAILITCLFPQRCGNGLPDPTGCYHPWASNKVWFAALDRWWKKWHLDITEVSSRNSSRNWRQNMTKHQL